METLGAAVIGGLAMAILASWVEFWHWALKRWWRPNMSRIESIRWSIALPFGLLMIWAIMGALLFPSKMPFPQ